MAERDTSRSHETRADARDSTDPPVGEKRLRLPLKTIDDVKAELARLYREGKAGRRAIGDVSRLANVLGILGRLIESEDLAARIEALEDEAMRAAAGGPAARGTDEG
ncbi:hypothetical protein [Piscinibacter defluvii]|uniref:hypothetical protein n=1 Tax=Piscinibacter defluvii TaxID=1796922 RepID=UPI00197C4774|nr:hypothetical protein [Piscinibacter defluvii]